MPVRKSPLVMPDTPRSSGTQNRHCLSPSAHAGVCPDHSATLTAARAQDYLAVETAVGSPRQLEDRSRWQAAKARELKRHNHIGPFAIGDALCQVDQENGNLLKVATARDHPITEERVWIHDDSGICIQPGHAITHGMPVEGDHGSCLGFISPTNADERVIVRTPFTVPCPTPTTSAQAAMMSRVLETRSYVRMADEVLFDTPAWDVIPDGWVRRPRDTGYVSSEMQGAAVENPIGPQCIAPGPSSSADERRLEVVPSRVPATKFDGPVQSIPSSPPMGIAASRRFVRSVDQRLVEPARMRDVPRQDWSPFQASPPPADQAVIDPHLFGVPSQMSYPPSPPSLPCLSEFQETFSTADGEGSVPSASSCCPAPAAAPGRIEAGVCSLLKVHPSQPFS